MSAPTIYRSGDASAPVLTGTAGSLTDLLDACLVDGYGSKVGAGWTKAYTATNQRAYRQGGGNQFYLDIDDRGASGVLTGGSGKEAAVRGYETMSAVSTGTGAFPTTGQVAVVTSNWRKSASADTVPRGWLLAADDRSLILNVLNGDTAGLYNVVFFGDTFSLLAGDSYRASIMIRTVVNSNTVSGLQIFSGIAAGAQTTGYYYPRTSDGSIANFNGSLFSTGTQVDNNGGTPSIGGFSFVSRILSLQSLTTLNIRGWLRGIYKSDGSLGLNDGDTIQGTGDFAGRSFLCLRSVGIASAAVLIETTQWDTSN